MGIDRKRMLEVADGVERTLKRVDAVLARKDAGTEHWVYSGKTSKHVSKHPTLEAAKREANKLETSSGYEHHVHQLSSLGSGAYAVKSRHFPDWNRVTSGNRSNWTSEKGSPEDRVFIGSRKDDDVMMDADAGAASVQAHKVLRSEGWKHANNDEPRGKNLQTHTYRHEKFPGHVVTTRGANWKHSEWRGVGKTDVKHGEGNGDASLAFHLSHFAAT